MSRPIATLALTFFAATLSLAIVQCAKPAAEVSAVETPSAAPSQPATTAVAAAGETATDPNQVSFSADQVTHGRGAYMANCAYCHGVDLGGLYGPALAGPNTKVSWGTVAGVWGYTTTQMPVANAGGLSQTDYLNIVAYILERNGQHPGKDPLTATLAANDNGIVGGTAR